MTEQELRDFEELFATNAWQRMVKDAEDAIREREAAALRAQSFEEVCFYRGEVSQLSVIVSLEQAIAMAKLARLDEDDE
jgi:hypothetical protein